MSTRPKPAELAIIGLLYLSGKGSHGYDLARHFASGEPLGEVLRLEPGMLYHHLKRMEASGLVESVVMEQQSRPARQRYTLSSEGKHALFEWLNQPVSRTRDIRIDFLIKLFFARTIEPDIAKSLVRQQLEICDGLARSLEQQIVDIGDRPSDPEVAFLRSVLQLRLSQNEAAIRWLKSV